LGKVRRRRVLVRLLGLSGLLLLFSNLPRMDLPGAGRGGLAAGALPTERSSIHPQVWEDLKETSSADVLLILRAQADLTATAAPVGRLARGHWVYDRLWDVASTSQKDLRASLEAQGIDYQPFYVVNALRLRVDRALLLELAARSEVERIVPNVRVRGIPAAVAPGPAGWEGESRDHGLSGSAARAGTAPAAIEPNLVRVHAPAVWDLGYTGQGIVVAGQDTGYEWDHPALRVQYRGWDGVTVDHDRNWHDAIHEDDPNTAPGNRCGFDSAVPCDDHGHGTHTMGTVVGEDGQGNQIGMAPGARWMGCRNMEEGWGTPATYLECFEFFLAPYPLGGTPADGDPGLAPHVVNNSWSCPPAEGCDTGTLEAAVVALRQAGIVVVVSAGNSGSSCGTVSSPPALYRQSFTVGNFDHASGQIAISSSRGPVTYGGQTYNKPDITAPGTMIRSSVPGGAYGQSSGTSMAAPHVTGAVALLLSARPSLIGDVESIEERLRDTAEPKTTTQGCGGDGPADVPNNVWGWGILDALAAIQGQAGRHRIYVPLVTGPP
jgi:serine protease AprX